MTRQEGSCFALCEVWWPIHLSYLPKGKRPLWEEIPIDQETPGTSCEQAVKVFPFSQQMNNEKTQR